MDDVHLEDELPPGLAPVGGYTQQQYKKAREVIMNKKIAYGILARADEGRYGKLIKEIEESIPKREQ